MVKSRGVNDKAVADAVEDETVVKIAKDDLSSFFCSASTTSFSPDSLESLHVPENVKSGLLRKQPPSIITKHSSLPCLELDMRVCDTPETMITLLGLPSEEDGSASASDDRTFSPKHHRGSSGKSETCSAITFECDIDKKLTAVGKMNLHSLKENKFGNKIPQEKKKSSKEVEVIVVRNDFDGIIERKPAANGPRNPKLRAVNHKTPEKLQPNKKSMYSQEKPVTKRQPTTRNDVKVCPAAALLAQIGKNPNDYECCHNKGTAPKTPREVPKVQKKAETGEGRVKKPTKSTEVELFMPKLTVSNGKVVFESTKKPIVRKRVFSPLRTRATPSKKTEDILKEQALTFPCFQTTVTKINEVLTNTIKELKEKVDELLPTGSKIKLITEGIGVKKQHPPITERAIPTRLQKHGRVLQKNHGFATVKESSPLKWKISAAKNDQNCNDTVINVPSPPRKQKESPNEPLNLKTDIVHGKLPKSGGTLGRKIERTGLGTEIETREAPSGKPRVNCTTDKGQTWQQLKKRQQVQNKSYKQVYLENVIKKGNTWKDLREKNLSLLNKSADVLHKDSEENVFPRYQSRTKDVSWIHSYPRGISHINQKKEPQAKCDRPLISFNTRNTDDAMPSWNFPVISRTTGGRGYGQVD